MNFAKGSEIKKVINSLPEYIVRCINDGDLSVLSLEDDDVYNLNNLGWVEDEDSGEVFSFKDYFLNNHPA
jgi:hypothetical protein